MIPPDFDVVAKRADALAALVEARLPMEADVVGLHQAWPLVAPALLSHATSTMRSIVLLGPAGAHTDASRLLRSLYDHVVTFAWLAADPSAERLAVWRLEDLVQRLKAAREMAEAGEPILDAAARDEMQREVDAATRTTTPDLAAKALAADRYWAPQVDALDEAKLGSFRGMYTVLFRSHSGLVHATFRGLNAVVVDLSPTRRRVLAQPPLNGRGAYGMATIVHGLGLLVASRRSAGRPRRTSTTCSTPTRRGDAARELSGLSLRRSPQCRTRALRSRFMIARGPRRFGCRQCTPLRVSFVP